MIFFCIWPSGKQMEYFCTLMKKSFFCFFMFWILTGAVDAHSGQGNEYLYVMHKSSIVDIIDKSKESLPNCVTGIVESSEDWHKVFIGSLPQFRFCLRIFSSGQFCVMVVKSAFRAQEMGDNPSLKGITIKMVKQFVQAAIWFQTSTPASCTYWQKMLCIRCPLWRCFEIKWFIFGYMHLYSS